MANLEEIIVGKTARDTEWKTQQAAERENVTEMQDCGIELITTDPDQFIRYLTMQGDNPTYSPGNIAIAWWGCPMLPSSARRNGGRAFTAPSLLRRRTVG